MNAHDGIARRIVTLGGKGALTHPWVFFFFGAGLDYPGRLSGRESLKERKLH